jgi:protein O-GlcNAc transferase
MSKNKTGRNDPCYCGSGKKFKHCCFFINEINVTQPQLTPQLQLQISMQIDIALEHHNAMRIGEAEQIYRQILQIDPSNPDANNLLGLLAHQVGENQLATELINKAISIKPNFAEAYSNLGIVMHAIGNIDDARKNYKKAISLNPNLVMTYNNYGNILFLNDRKHSEAIECYQKAIKINPNFFLGHLNLANVYKEQENFLEAEKHYQYALILAPESSDAYLELGYLFNMQNKISEAIDCFRNSIKLNPSLVSAHYALADILIRTWRIDEAIEHYQIATNLEPDFQRLQNLLLFMQYSGNINDIEIDNKLTELAKKYEYPLFNDSPKHKNTLNPKRRLKIGYVSADLRTHPVVNFIEPVLENYSHSDFEVYCYYSYDFEDETTLRLKSLVDHWVFCNMSDELLAKRIQDDEIDILIDLSGHTAGSRLLTFAYKPAPIQISWMGYVGSTGFKSIDYRFSDPFLEYQTTDSPLKEEIPLLLNPIWYVYRPCIKNPQLRISKEMQVENTPAISNGYITFGCFNNLNKVTPKTIVVWSTILKTLPTAKIILISNNEVNIRSNVLNEFSLNDINKEQIIFLDFSDENHYLLYHHIDIVLDPFPYNGGTTTCDGLWMGVPFITLEGKSTRSRMGVTLANNIGHPEWVAKNEAGYIEKSIKLASNISQLNQLRLSLRSNMENSPLMDENAFILCLEATYKKIWEEYCTRTS